MNWKQMIFGLRVLSVWSLVVHGMQTDVLRGAKRLAAPVAIKQI